MRIRIYNEPRGGSIGGSEVSAAVLAASLAQEHDVELVHYRPAMTREALAQFAAVDLSAVSVGSGPPQRADKGPFWKVAARYQAEQKEEAALTGGCDVFIAFVHEPPPFCTAPIGILWVLFPFHPLNDPNPAKRLWYRWKLRARLRGYQTKLAISGFSRTWTRARWETEADVLFPPVQTDFTDSGEKRNRILSVGRFATDGHGKKQIEMLNAFCTVQKASGGSWGYDCAGACGSSAVELSFLEKVRTLARECGANVMPNIDRLELRAAYGRAKIFWHAAGMDIDEEVEPERAEHFGITTVEAMAAGCVPVVINKGGQREIVEHGVSGFLWNTLDELTELTLGLMSDEALRQRMSEAARERAQKFSRDAFVNGFRALLPNSSIAGKISERKTDEFATPCRISR